MIIEELNKCKTCGAYPDIEFFKKYITLTCPLCGRSSSTYEVHGFEVEVAIDDWNKHHGDQR